MKTEIFELLQKYEDMIMDATLGNKLDEYGDRYSYVYKHEWSNCRDDLSFKLSELFENIPNLSIDVFSYMILAEWCSSIGFDWNNIDTRKLKFTCQMIVDDLIRIYKNK